MRKLTAKSTIMTFSITSHRLGRRHDYVGRRHYINTTKINGASSTKHYAIEIASNNIASHDKWLMWTT